VRAEEDRYDAVQEAGRTAEPHEDQPEKEDARCLPGSSDSAISEA
jgi:hypothetical protein